MDERKAYPSDLSGEQWAVVGPFLDAWKARHPSVSRHQGRYELRCEVREYERLSHHHGAMVRCVDPGLSTDQLEVLANAFPQRSYLWANTATTFVAALEARCRQELGDNATPAPVRLAAALHDFSNRLRDVGRREDALAAVTEAVETRRELARVRPDAFLPDLATSLNNLALRLTDVGRTEDGLAAITEAITFRLQLSGMRPAVRQDELDQSLAVRNSLHNSERT